MTIIPTSSLLEVMDKLPNQERGFAHILVILIIVLGLIMTTYLVQQKTNLFSRASGGDRAAWELLKNGKWPRGKVTPTPTMAPTFTPTPTATPTITPTPTIVGKRVFVTSGSFSGNLGGILGADSKCQTSADNASLGGLWRAWLSGDGEAAQDRLNHADIPYKRLDEKLVAQNWSDLVDGTLISPISITERKAYVSDHVWTGTFTDGNTNGNGARCLDWTSSVDYSGAGGVGYSGAVDQRWSYFSSFYCNQYFRLYCLEQ